MIKAYVGLPGFGKTLNMVYDIMPIIKKGRKVYSNTPIRWKEETNHEKKEYTARWIPRASDFEYTLFHETNCDFLVDEASVFLPAQLWSKIPGEYLKKFSEARHYGCNIYYTTQSFGHALKRLRDLTNLVVSCSKKIWIGILPPFATFVFEARTFLPQFFKTESSKAYERFFLFKRTLYPSTYRRVINAYKSTGLESIVDFNPHQKNR